MHSKGAQPKQRRPVHQDVLEAAVLGDRRSPRPLPGLQDEAPIWTLQCTAAGTGMTSSSSSETCSSDFEFRPHLGAECTDVSWFTPTPQRRRVFSPTARSERVVFVWLRGSRAHAAGDPTPDIPRPGNHCMFLKRIHTKTQKYAKTLKKVAMCFRTYGNDCRNGENGDWAESSPPGVFTLTGKTCKIHVDGMLSTPVLP